MPDSKNSETISHRVKTALADCTKEDYRFFNSIMSSLSKLTSAVEYNGILKCIGDNVSHLSHEMSTKIIESLPSCSVWMGYEPPIPSSIINLHIILCNHTPDLFDDICRVFVELVHFRNPSVDFSTLTDLITQFFVGLSQSATHSIDMIIRKLVKKMPNWRRTTFDVISSSVGLLFLLCSPNCSIFLNNNQKCTLLSVLFEIIIELELNADSLPADDLSAAFKTQEFAENIPLNNYPSLVQNISLMLKSLNPSDNSFRAKLELLVWLILSHIKSICRSSTSNSSIDWDLLCAIFRRLRDLFAEHVIPVSTKLNIFPFICFYVCSLRGGLTINFAEFLLSTVKDERRDVGSRITSLSYLVSLVVRANYCLLELAVELLHEMATWCVDYTYRNRSVVLVPHRNLLLSEHRMYYAIFNAVIYLLVQLHAPLLDNSHYYSRCQRLPLAQILLSPFKPLEHTPESLRSTFLRIASIYHLGWSITGLDQVTSTSSSSLVNHNSVWNTEFLQNLPPSAVFSLSFKDYNLSFSKKFVDPLIRSISIGQKLQETNPNKSDATQNPNKSLKRRIKSDLDLNLGVDVSKFAKIVEDV